MPENVSLAKVPPGRILRGSGRRRVAWLLLLFSVGLFAIGSSRHWFPAGLMGPIANMATPASVILKELVQLFIVLTVTLVMGAIKGESLSAYGLPVRHAFGKDFRSGAVWGFVMLSVTVALMAATHSYSLGALALSSRDLVKFGLLWAIAFLLVGFTEELAFRGYLQYTLTTRIGFWPASIVTCLFFAFAHRNNPGENWIGLSNIAIIGVFACVVLRRTGSLWFPIGWHMAFDWGQSFFYSVADSGQLVGGHLFNASVNGKSWLTGGAIGPEASVFNVVVTLAGIALFVVLYPEVRYRQAPRSAGA
jgi:membrane protease YdiL (CAAX protease family)